MEEGRQIFAKSHLSDDFFECDFFILEALGVERFVEFSDLSSFSGFKEGHQLYISNAKNLKDYSPTPQHPFIDCHISTSY